MKKIMKKRVIFYCPWTEELVIGAEEFDGALSDDNILGAFYETGKAIWRPTIHPDYDELWYLKETKMGLRLPYYKVEIDNFYIEVPTFWDKIKDALR